MKPIPILVILLALSVIYNIYQFTQCPKTEMHALSNTVVSTDSLSQTTTDTSGTKADKSCITTPPFALATAISTEQAKAFYNQYKGTLPPPDVTTGGIISRDGFDKMLCTAGCNGIAYSLGRDLQGRVGPANNGVFVFFQAVNIDYDTPNNTIIRVNPIPGAYIYTAAPGQWCPPNCMKLE